MTVGRFLLAAVLFSIAAWMIICAMIQLWKPIEDLQIFKYRRKWLEACQGAGFLGWLWIFYAAFSNILSFLPDNWGGIDEDGEWRPIESTLSTIIAFPVALAVMSRLESFHKMNKQLRYIADEKKQQTKPPI